MNKLLILLLGTSYLCAAILTDINTFHAHFIQHIDDGNKKIVSYEGEVFAKKPKLALWRYLKPIRKDVYIVNDKVTVIEPELEQAIIRTLHDDFDIFTLLNKATKIQEGLYQAKYKNITFKLYFEKKEIKKLLYKDNFENIVTIIFDKQQYNAPIKESFFVPRIPKEFDIIIE